MTAPADRRKALEILDAAVAAGARAHKVAELLDVGLTTLQRWRRQFAGVGDGLDRRKGSHRLVSHRLSDEERQRILFTCNEPEFAALPPGQIVPILADRGLYIGSERSFYRVLHAHSQVHRRGRARLSAGIPSSPVRCRGWRPGDPMRSGAGTSPTCPPASVASGCTSIW